jgi:predicted phosphoribosyltransferase
LTPERDDSSVAFLDRRDAGRQLAEQLTVLERD